MSPPRSNRNIILISVVVAGVALLYGVLNFHRAFPEIAVNFKVSRSEALQTASDFLQSRNLDLSGYHESIVFTYDDWAKVYLERELGVERTVSLTRDSIDVWWWQARFFKPLEKLEYRVSVDPYGRVVGFRRSLLESTPGPELAPENASILAEAFITGPMEMALEQWEHIEASSIDRPARRDHTFTYELKGFKAAEAPYRMEVGVQGAQVGSFLRFLKVPQEWRRDYDRQRAQNELFQNIATFLAFLMIIAVFIHFFRNIRGGQVPWRTLLWLGGILAVVNFIMGMNSLPLSLAGYDTTESYSAFLGQQILFSVINGLIQGMLLILLFGAGEWLYRRDHPGKLFLPSLLSRRGFRSGEFMQATLMGYLLAAFHVGFFVFYYIVGKKIGFWTPADVKYSNAVSTALPWIYPLAISLGAALLEEFWFRLFGISFCKRLFKSTALAIIIPAFIWGFLHSAYPQQPGFARGIEVGLIGIVAGLVMLRFGIWATLTWHFVIDAIFIGLFLFQSDNAYFWVSGLIVCGGLAVPAIVAGVQYLRRKGFEPIDDIANRAIESPPRRQPPEEHPAAPEIPEVAVEPPEYKPLSVGIRKIALLVGAAGIIIALLPGPRRFGEDFSVQYNREKAIEVAGRAIHERYGVDPAEYKVAAITSASLRAVREKPLTGLSYVKRHGSLSDAERIFLSPKGINHMNWLVSFKKELDPESYKVNIDLASGHVFTIHTMADTAAGAQLDPDSARVLATAAFQETEPEPDRYHTIEERSKKRDNRIDHYFTYETIDPVIGDAHFRRNISVKGGEVETDGRWFKLPEEWTRHEKAKTLRWVLVLALSIGLMLSGIIVALISFGKRVARRELRWKAGLIAGGIVLALSLLSHWNDWATVWWGYRTSQPAANFIITQFIGATIAIIFSALFVVVVVALTESLVREHYGRSPWLGLGGASRRAAEDGVVNVICLIGIAAGVGWLFGALSGWFNLPVHSFSIRIPGTLVAYLPWFGELSSEVLRAIIMGSLIMAAFILLDDGVKRGWLRWLILLAVAVVVAGGVTNPTIGNLTGSEFLWQLARAMVVISIFYLIMRNWVAGRLWALMAALLLGSLIKSGVTFLGWGISPFSSQGWTLLILAAAMSLWLLLRAFRQ